MKIPLTLWAITLGNQPFMTPLSAYLTKSPVHFQFFRLIMICLSPSVTLMFTSCQTSAAQNALGIHPWSFASLLRPQAAIRKELNEFKSTEMEVHASSKHLTRLVFRCGTLTSVLHACAILVCSSLNLALLAHLEGTGKLKIDGIASNLGRGRLSLWELMRSGNGKCWRHRILAECVWTARRFAGCTSDPERTGGERVSSPPMHRAHLLLKIAFD